MPARAAPIARALASNGGRQFLEPVPPFYLRHQVRHEWKVPRPDAQAMLEEKIADCRRAMGGDFLVQGGELGVITAEAVALGERQAFAQGC